MQTFHLISACFVTAATAATAAAAITAATAASAAKDKASYVLYARVHGVLEPLSYEWLPDRIFLSIHDDRSPPPPKFSFKNKMLITGKGKFMKVLGFKDYHLSFGSNMKPFKPDVDSDSRITNINPFVCRNRNYAQGGYIMTRNSTTETMICFPSSLYLYESGRVLTSAKPVSHYKRDEENGAIPDKSQKVHGHKKKPSYKTFTCGVPTATAGPHQPLLDSPLSPCKLSVKKGVEDSGNSGNLENSGNLHSRDLGNSESSGNSGSFGNLGNLLHSRDLGNSENSGNSHNELMQNDSPMQDSPMQDTLMDTYTPSLDTIDWESMMVDDYMLESTARPRDDSITYQKRQANIPLVPDFIELDDLMVDASVSKSEPNNNMDPDTPPPKHHKRGSFPRVHVPEAPPLANNAGHPTDGCEQNGPHMPNTGTSDEDSSANEDPINMNDLRNSNPGFMDPDHVPAELAAMPGNTLKPNHVPMTTNIPIPDDMQNDGSMPHTTAMEDVPNDDSTPYVIPDINIEPTSG